MHLCTFGALGAKVNEVSWLAQLNDGVLCAIKAGALGVKKKNVVHRRCKEDSAPSIVHGASAQPLCKEAQGFVVLHLIHPMTLRSPKVQRCKGAQSLMQNLWCKKRQMV